MVIQLGVFGVNSNWQNYERRCENIVKEQLLLIQIDGWQPAIPTDFKYLKKNKHFSIHRNMKWAKTSTLGFLSILTGVIPICYDTIYDSVTIPLFREVEN